MGRMAGWAWRRTAARSLSLGAPLALAVPLALSACGSAPPPPTPTTVELTVTGAKDLNPDPNDRPSPVMLRVYQLGPSDAFANADFFQIIDQDKATLGPTLLDRQEIAVAPESSQTIAIAPKPDARTIAIAAAFRAYEEAGWRAMAPILPNTKNQWRLDVQARKVTLAPPEAEPEEKPSSPFKTGGATE
ncbi:type VI secretion system lipoprotein TssJ [Azospirillum doebereinerae]|uniref:type VI secretion system lipoprotein TssJ n=1 Tax=Azospirillum doebereinerae TaxID=92933 RepID=UPI001EE55601|nr:type VI secretion system lipoprotein TssJ [Azospirillum doebereinerae]MCG5240218.1 type VI secretion system lipoprotein TssJ [Azospirillum doebereinerae]